MFAGSRSSSPRSADSSAEGAALDHQLTEVYLRQDWAALEKIVAPDYSGFAADEQWDFSALKREFPKIHLKDLHVERQQVKRLSPDLILVSDVLTMHETYAGQNISGLLELRHMGPAQWQVAATGGTRSTAQVICPRRWLASSNQMLGAGSLLTL